MDELEKQLREVLAPEEAPAWFEAKVLARVAQQRSPVRNMWFARFAGATALAFSVALIGGAVYQRHEQEKGMAAKARLELALKITSTQLNKIQRIVDSVN